MDYQGFIFLLDEKKDNCIILVELCQENHHESDALLEASLVVAFESDDTSIYGTAPKDALIALLSHRAPGLYLELRTRMLNNDNILNKDDIRDALIDVGAYYSTIYKPANKIQREKCEWNKSKGNEYFKKKKWSKASEYYTNALECISGGSTNVSPLLYSEDEINI